MRLARQLVERWRQVPHAAIPGDVGDAAHLLHAIGAGLAAAAATAGRPYRRAARALNGSSGPAPLVDGAARVVAALANAGVIHAPEFDDTHAGSIVHGSSVAAATAPVRPGGRRREHAAPLTA